ncbi:MAG: DUF1844 domain-containing protein [Phycisphaeraceae bacterium]
MSNEDPSPILHVDDDWKAQAQAEKAKLAEKEKAAKDAAGETADPGTGGAATGRSAAPGQIPPADFTTLVSSIATQALFSMGAMPDPQTGQRYTNLDIARHHIDSLGVLDEKTKGNLSEDEATMLSTTLYELRQSYVQIANASRSPATGGSSQ